MLIRPEQPLLASFYGQLRPLPNPKPISLNERCSVSLESIPLALTPYAVDLGV